MDLLMELIDVFYVFLRFSGCFGTRDRHRNIKKTFKTAINKSLFRGPNSIKILIVYRFLMEKTMDKQ